MADDFVEVDVSPEQLKKLDSSGVKYQSISGPQPVRDDVHDFLPTAGAAKPDPNLGEGLGNIFNAGMGGLGQGLTSLGNTIQNPGPLLGQISNAFQTEANSYANESPSQAIDNAMGRPLFEGAALGTAHLANGLLGIPSALQNAYMGQAVSQPSIQIPTGGLEQSTARYPVSGALGELMPFIAIDALTAGAATPELLAAQRTMQAAKATGNAEKIAEAAGALKAAQKSTLLESLTTKNPLRPAKLGEKVAGGLGRAAGSGLEYGLLGTPGSLEERANAGLTNAAVGAGLHLGGKALGVIPETVGTDTSADIGVKGIRDSAPTQTGEDLFKDPVTGKLMPKPPEATDSANVPEAEPGVLTGRVSNNDPVESEGFDLPEGTPVPTEDEAAAIRQQQTGQPADYRQPTTQHANVANENMEAVGPSWQQDKGALDSVSQMRQRQQQLQGQNQAVANENQESFGPSWQQDKGAMGAVEQMRARQQELAQQQAEQAMNAKADELHGKLINYERIGAKTQANKLKAEIAEQAATHPDPVQRAAYQRALEKYAPAQKAAPAPQVEAKPAEGKVKVTLTEKKLQAQVKEVVPNEAQGQSQQPEGQQPAQGAEEVQPVEKQKPVESRGQEEVTEPEKTVQAEVKKKSEVDEALDTISKPVDTEKDSLFARSKPQGTDQREHLQAGQAPQGHEFKSPSEIEREPAFLKAYSRYSIEHQEKLKTIADAIDTKKKTLQSFYNPKTKTATGILTKRAEHGQELYTPKGLSARSPNNIEAGEIVSYKGKDAKVEEIANPQVYVNGKWYAGNDSLKIGDDFVLRRKEGNITAKVEDTKPRLVKVNGEFVKTSDLDPHIYVHGYNENSEWSHRRLDRFQGEVTKTTESGYEGLYRHPSNITEGETFHPANAILEQVSNPILKKQIQGKPIVDSDYRQAQKTLEALIQEAYDANPESMSQAHVDEMLERLPDQVKENLRKNPCD